jgi:hypothetical protein
MEATCSSEMSVDIQHGVISQKIVLFTLEQVTHFRYLGYDVTFLEETDLDIKTETIHNIYDTIRSLTGTAGKVTQIKCYQSDGRFYAAVRKRTLDNDDKRHTII